MTAARINLPRLRLAHPPDFDHSVISGGNDQWKRGMEHGVVDAPVMAFQDVFHRRERVEGLEAAWIVGSNTSGT